MGAEGGEQAGCVAVVAAGFHEQGVAAESVYVGRGDEGVEDGAVAAVGFGDVEPVLTDVDHGVEIGEEAVAPDATAELDVLGCEPVE